MIKKILTCLLTFTILSFGVVNISNINKLNSTSENQNINIWIRREDTSNIADYFVGNIDKAGWMNINQGGKLVTSTGHMTEPSKQLVHLSAPKDSYVAIESSLWPYYIANATINIYPVNSHDFRSHYSGYKNEKYDFLFGPGGKEGNFIFDDIKDLRNNRYGAGYDSRRKKWFTYFQAEPWLESSKVDANKKDSAGNELWNFRYVLFLTLFTFPTISYVNQLRIGTDTLEDK